jgi:replication factor C subunit 1
MDIRNFFGKKGGSGVVSSKQKAASSDKVTSHPQSKKGIAKLAIQDNDDDDEDDVKMIEDPFVTRSNASVNGNSRQSPFRNRSIPQREMSKVDREDEERDIFLDDTDSDDEYIQPVSSPAKKKRKSLEVKSPPKSQTMKLESSSAQLRSSPRRKTAPPVSRADSPAVRSAKKVPLPSKALVPKFTALPSTLSRETFDMTAATPQCLLGCTFCFTGILADVSREEAVDMVKILGGRVTTAVSGKTTYLVLGDILEDGRPVEEGSKYKRATTTESSTILVLGTNFFYGLLQQYSDQAANNIGTANHTSGDLTLSNHPPASSPAVVPAPAASSAKPAATTNPYKSGAAAASNPYARKSNPYAKMPAATAVVDKPSAVIKSNVVVDRKMPAALSSDAKSNGSQLWVDKYKPKHSSEILGNQEAVRKLTVWLSTWEDVFNSSNNKVKSFSAPNGPWKAALLSGPPGIGSTFFIVCLA